MKVMKVRKTDVRKMDEIYRVVNYIKSCRTANIDVTITIDKEKSHLILNALQKALPNSHECITDEDYRTCGNCGSDVDVTYDDYKYCPYCGQML